MTDWKVHIADKRERQRNREAHYKMLEALAQDEKEARERGSGLPKDWRSRRLN